MYLVRIGRDVRRGEHSRTRIYEALKVQVSEQASFMAAALRELTRKDSGEGVDASDYRPLWTINLALLPEISLDDFPSRVESRDFAVCH